MMRNLPSLPAKEKENPAVLLVFALCLLESLASAAPLGRSEIMKQLQLDPAGKTPVVKNFPAGFPEALTAPGEALVYTRENSSDFEYIGMPVGGIGAGQLYLGGDGQLWFWDIFGLNYRIGQLKGEGAYQNPYTRSKPTTQGARMPDQGFSISVKSGARWVTRHLNRDGIKDIEFLGQYPIGEVTYRDPDLPVTVQLEAFSPFIPLDLDESLLPATVMSFTVRNTSSSPVEAKVTGWLENLVLVGAREAGAAPALEGKLVNETVTLPGGALRIDYSVLLDANAPIAAVAEKKTDYGTMSLALLGDGVTANAAHAELPLGGPGSLMGKLDRALRLAPGEVKTATFVLTWHFPKTRAVYAEGRRMKDRADVETIRTNYYARLFADATAVSEHVIGNFDRLAGATREWRRTWYDSTLPGWFLDRTFLNASILASSTSHVIDDRLFYGTEGGNQGPGTCTHVWAYAQAMGRLFPDLEKSLREQVDFRLVSEGGAMQPNGQIKFRWFTGEGMAVDGQSGCILRAYLSHQLSPDDAFLKRVYPGLKMAMQGLTEGRDADHDGILTGPQHNTLDAAWYGKVTWLSLFYNAALRATAEMADEMDDHEYATFCRSTADQGRRYIEEHLFNGEYFIHEPDPEHPDSPGTYNGLEYSQLVGQGWAYQVGLGQIIDPVKAKTALESKWRYNFTTDVGPFREIHRGGRWYAMPGEGGLIACTWPNGGSEVLDKGLKRFADYNNECQNGYEYAASALMMWQDMPYHSLAHIWYMHNDRYHGSKRNPWCEVEWGVHYSRSMASYGHFTAACGFEYHGPHGYLAFAPKITPDNFRAAFTAAEGWGSFAQQRSGNTLAAHIGLKHGALHLQTLGFELPAGQSAKSVRITRDASVAVASTFRQEGDRIIIELSTPQTLTAGQAIQIQIN